MIKLNIIFLCSLCLGVPCGLFTCGFPNISHTGDTHTHTHTCAVN